MHTRVLEPNEPSCQPHIIVLKHELRACTHTHTHVEARGQTQVSFLWTSAVYFETVSFTGLKLTFRLERLSTEPQPASGLIHPVLGL